MDTETIVNFSISGAALAFSVFVFVDNLIHRKKYEDPHTVLEIAEKEKSLEEEKKAFIRCTPLKREEKKLPHFLVENIGRHAAVDLVLEKTQCLQPVDSKLFPFPKLDPGQGVEVYYMNYSRGESSIMLRFAYKDGLGDQTQEVALQI